MAESRVRKVVVTGAEGALGGAVASRFLEAGCEVIGTYHSHRPQNEKIQWVQVDLADPQALERALSPHLAGVDGLIHCAGGFRYGRIDEISDADVRFLVHANLLSSIHLLRLVVPRMRAAGFGRIVMVSAKATLAPGAGMGVYAATKAGINALVHSVAEELKPADITINAVMPSMIDTPANRKDMPKADYSKWVGREELAGIIFRLTEPESRSIQGALIPVSGRL